MVQTLNRCRSCGLPGKLAERLEWRSGGTITLNRMRYMRLALMDESTMESIRDVATAAVGDAAFMTAHKEAAYLAAGKIMAGIKSRLTRYGAVKKRALEAMEEYSLLLGMGRIEMEKFAPGGGGSLLLHRPFDITAVAGGITGVLEEMDRCGYRMDITAAGERLYRIVLESTGSGDRGDSYPHDFAFGREKHEGEKVKGCPMCGLPDSISMLSWDEVYGTVAAGRGGRRVAFLPAYILYVASSLGKDGEQRGLNGLVEEAIYDATRRNIEAGSDDAYESKAVVPLDGDVRAACASMRMRGWGEVAAYGLLGQDWWFEVVNTVHEGLIAGWLRAIYAAATGKEAPVGIEKGRTGTVFRLG